MKNKSGSCAKPTKKGYVGTDMKIAPAPKANNLKKKSMKKGKKK